MPHITSPLLLARRAPMSPALPLIAAGFACAALASGASIVVAALLAALVGSVVAAVVDLQTGAIPDETVLVIAISALLAGAVRGNVVDVVTGAGVVGVPLFVTHAVGPRAMGFGDVKLGFALGAAVGLVEPVLGLPLLFAASGSAIIAGLVTRRSSVPFAPALVVGAMCSLAAAGPLTSILTGGAPSWR